MVCEFDNDIMGVLNLRFEGQLHHSEYIAEIMEFVITSSYRNRGIGKEMLANAGQLAKEAGCNQLRENTHRFYAREGMHNFHFKFSQSLIESGTAENVIGN